MGQSAVLSHQMTRFESKERHSKKLATSSTESTVSVVSAERSIGSGNDSTGSNTTDTKSDAAGSRAPSSSSDRVGGSSRSADGLSTSDDSGYRGNREGSGSGSDSGDTSDSSGNRTIGKGNASPVQGTKTVSPDSIDTSSKGSSDSDDFNMNPRRTTDAIMAAAAIAANAMKRQGFENNMMSGVPKPFRIARIPSSEDESNEASEKRSRSLSGRMCSVFFTQQTGPEE